MQLGWTAADEAFRDQFVAFLDERCPAEAVEYGRKPDAGSTAVIPEWSREWQAALFDHGWMVPGYPPELGGRNATPIQTLIYLEELAKRNVPRSLHFPGYAIVAPSLLEYGDDAQRALAPAAIRGDTVWCIGMSEPDAGSDLASLKTAAVRVTAPAGAGAPAQPPSEPEFPTGTPDVVGADEMSAGEKFVVNGQKVWTSYAMVADRCMCYVRTDPEAPKHKGISVLIVDMDTPGLEIRPLRHISGAAEFAEVFFNDVDVPAENLLGDLNDGWRITTGSLAHERGGLWVPGVARCVQTVDELVEVAKRRGLDADAGVRRRVAASYEQAASLRALGYKGFAGFAQGESSPEHSYMKYAYSELLKNLFELGTELLGPFGAVEDDPRADDGVWWRRFSASFAGTIAGGASEIQKNIIATRVLGLPRA